MEALNLTPAELSRRVEESPQTYNNWKKRGKIPGDKIFKVADVLECSARWLAVGVEEAVDQVNKPQAQYSPGINESAVKNAITVIKFIENKTQSTLSIDQWSELFTHFYNKYVIGQKTGKEVDKADLVFDYHSIIENKKNKSPETEK